MSPARKLSRKKSHREHMLRNLATSLILFEHVETTVPKAKEVKALVDHFIAQSKSQSLQARRELKSQLFTTLAVKKVFEVIVPRFENQASGFVRMTKIGHRLGDAAAMAHLELIIEVKEQKEAKTDTTPKAAETIQPAKEKATRKPRAAKTAPETNTKKST